MVFALTQIVVHSLLWLLIGVALLIVYPFDPSTLSGEAAIQKRERTFAKGMDELLPIGARGLMLTGMLAALASTLDTHLNWGASYWSNDLYKGIWVERILGRKADDRELVRVGRLSALVILAIALAIMVNLDSIQTAWQISLIFAPLLILTTRQEWIRLAAMSGISLSAVIATAWLTPPTGQRKLVEFYRRVCSLRSPHSTSGENRPKISP